jgi:uncharacterized protein (DUF1015 family)
MAVVKPFRGVRYNLERFDNMQALVSQPYDKITEELQQQYYALSPYNITHIIQGMPEESDSPDAAGMSVYSRAKDYYQQWLDEGIFVQEQQPVMYAYEQTFDVGDKHYVRLGLIAAVEVTDFEEGVILPHERTHAGPKADRLRLLDTLKVNTEQIFVLYPDPENHVNTLIRQTIGEREPDIDVEEIAENGVRQRLWIITDTAIIEAIQQKMAPMQNLIIADGHHRYETALNYRNAQRERYPNAPADAPFNYMPMMLVSMDDPGLTILAHHREIRNFSIHSPAVVLERARKHFFVTTADNLESCLARVNGDPTGHTFGFYGGPDVGFHLLKLRDERLPDMLIPNGYSHEWKSLPVSVLHRILLELVAEVPVEGVLDRTMIRYRRDASRIVANIDAGKSNFGVFLSPTRMEYVRVCAGRGERLPQKSTDFYPKVISGLAMMPVDYDDQA